MLITWHDVNKFLNCIRIQDSYEAISDQLFFSILKSYEFDFVISFDGYAF